MTNKPILTVQQTIDQMRFESSERNSVLASFPIHSWDERVQKWVAGPLTGNVAIPAPQGYLLTFARKLAWTVIRLTANDKYGVAKRAHLVASVDVACKVSAVVVIALVAAGCGIY